MMARPRVGTGTALVATFVATLLLAGPVQGQVNDDAACAQVATARNLEATTCFALSVFIVDNLSSEVLLAGMVDSVTSPRDMQSTGGEAPSVAGSPAVGEAVASARPVAVASGSLAAAGSDAGSSAITAISINPAIFFGGFDDVSSAAKLSRLMDMTALFPVDGLDQDDDGQIDYFGLRFRVNAFGPGILSRRDLAADAARALGLFVTTQVAQADALEPILMSAPRLAECVELIASGDTDLGAVQAACGDVPALRVEGQGTCHPCEPAVL